MKDHSRDFRRLVSVIRGVKVMETGPHHLESRNSSGYTSVIWSSDTGKLIAVRWNEDESCCLLFDVSHFLKRVRANLFLWQRDTGRHCLPVSCWDLVQRDWQKNSWVLKHFPFQLSYFSAMTLCFLSGFMPRQGCYWMLITCCSGKITFFWQVVFPILHAWTHNFSMDCGHSKCTGWHTEVYSWNDYTVLKY